MYLRAFRQVATLGATEAFGRLFTFVFTAALARAAGLSVLGNISLGLALIALITIVGDGGLNQDATRRLVRGESRSLVLRETMQFQLIACALVSIPVVVFSGVVYGGNLQNYLFFLLPIPIFMSLATPYLLDSVGQIGLLSAARIFMTVGIGSSGLVLLAVGWRGPGLGLAYVIGFGCGTISMLVFSRAPVRSALAPINREAFIKRFQVVRNLGLASVLLHVFVSAPMIIAGLSHRSGVLEQMGVVTRIWFLVSAPAAMAGSVLIPLFSRQRSAKGAAKVGLVAVGFGALGSAVFWVFATPILGVLYGQEAELATDALKIFALALPLIGGVAVASAFAISRRHDRIIASGYGVAVAVLLCVCAVDYPRLGADRLAWAWVTSYGCLLAVLVAGCARNLKRDDEEHVRETVAAN